MRKDIQKGLKSQKRKIFYLSSIGFVSILATIAVVIAIYSNISNTRTNNMYEITGLKEASDSKIDGTNSEDANNGDIKQASSGIGKTVNEVKEGKIEEDKNQENNTLIVPIDSNNENKVEKNVVNNVQNIETKPEQIKEENNQKEQETRNQKENVEKIQKEQEPTFSMPVDGDIIKEYAKDKLVFSETLKEWVTHMGIDIKAEKTSIVKASEAGTIKSIKNDPRYGLTVVIEHSMRI